MLARPKDGHRREPCTRIEDRAAIACAFIGHCPQHALASRTRISGINTECASRRSSLAKCGIPAFADCWSIAHGASIAGLAHKFVQIYLGHLEQGPRALENEVQF